MEIRVLEEYLTSSSEQTEPQEKTTQTYFDDKQLNKLQALYSRDIITEDFIRSQITEITNECLIQLQSQKR